MLQYCIKGSFKFKKNTNSYIFRLLKSILFDKTKKNNRGINPLKKSPYEIEAVTNIYENGYTEVQFGEIRIEIEITSGISQGFTGSTIILKTVPYMIMAELDRRGTWYNNEQITIK